MKRLLSLLCALALVAGFDVSAASGTVSQSFNQQGTGAQPFLEKAGDELSVFDFMTRAQIADVRARSASVDVTAAVQAAIARANVLGGAVVRVPAGTYSIAGSSLTLPANVWLRGETAVSSYDTVNLLGGTVFKVLTGDFAVHLSGRQSRLSNITLTGEGGTTEYCVVVTIPNTVVDGVTCHAFGYGFAGSALNSNLFWNISAHANRKIGFVVLPANVSGVGAFAYPKLEALVSGTTSTVFTVGGNSKFRSNTIGMALLAGWGAHVQDSVIESNRYYGLLIFKRDNTTNNLTFDNVYMENDALAELPWSLSGIDALKTSSGAYLVGDVSGAWSSATDSAHAIWVGSATEAYDQGGNLGLGPPTNIVFRNCTMIPKRGVLRLRSQRHMLIQRCSIQSMLGSTPISATANSYQLVIDNPVPVALHKMFSTFSVPGTQTLYRFDNSPMKRVNVASTSGAWVDIVNVATMTRGQKYRYSISIADRWAQYGQQGYVFYDGSTVQIVKLIDSAGSDVQIRGTTLQYQQTSGLAQNFGYSIDPDGPMGQPR